VARKREQAAEPVLAGVALPEPRRMIVPVVSIRHTLRNPRSDGDGGDLDGLVASLATTPEPYLVQPPAVEQVGPDEYVVLYGDRRIRAVEKAGWERVACDVYPRLNPGAAHDRRLLENLSRVEVHPIDQADGITIAWLKDNAYALDLAAAADAILDIEQPQPATIAQLTALLADAAWARSRPRVTQMDTLRRLGLAISQASLKKLMRLMALAEEAKAVARTIPELTAASLRAMGELSGDDQLALVRAVKGDPGLAAKVRRIARKVKGRGYVLERAISEARGQVWMGPQSAAGDGAPGDQDDSAAEGEPDGGTASAAARAAPDGSSGDRKAQSDAAMRLLEVAGALTEALAALRAALGGQPIGEMPPPWDEIVTESLDLIQQEIAALGAPVA